MGNFCGKDRDFWKNREDAFDFTSCFEDSVLTYFPALYLLFFGVVIYVARKSSPSFPQRPKFTLFLWKQGLTFLLILLDFLDSIHASLWDHKPPYRIASSGVLCFGFILCLILLNYEHSKGSRTSAFLAIFWVLALIVDIIRFRSQMLMVTHHRDNQYEVIYTSIHFGLVLVEAFLSLLKEPPVASQTNSRACPENSASLFSVVWFWWMNPLLASGFKRTLETSDLWNLNEEDQAQRLYVRLRNTWELQLTRQREEGKKPSLVSALRIAFGNTFFAAGFFKLGQDLLMFAGPLLLSAIINFMDDDSAPAWHGYGYVVLMFVAGVVQTMFLHQYFLRAMKTGMRIRSSVVTVVYNKALVLSTAARQTTTTGEISNLMAVDAQRFLDLMTYLHNIWSGPLQISLSLYFLWLQLGASVFAGLGAMICLLPLNAVIAKRTNTLQIAQMEQKDSRIKMMNEVLNGIKVLKLYAWEAPYKSLVMNIRGKEIDVLRSTAIFNAFSQFTWGAAPFIVSLVSFLAFTLSGHTLTAERAFVSLSLFNILRFPLSVLPYVISGLVEANVSINRLSKFLLLEEVSAENVNSANSNDKNIIEIQHGRFSWRRPTHEKKDKDEGGASNPQEQTVDETSSLLASSSSDRESKTEMRLGSFVLNNIDLCVVRGSLNAIVGKVGSGKSSLLCAMLGEMEKLNGNVFHYRRGGVLGGVAYVPQQPWILNTSLRENILFGRPFDAAFYTRVLKACSLEQDISILPGGDLTEIGEKGINLSGGQKARVSLARAVYRDAELYLLDDPLAAVDAHVGKHIFEHVIGPKGLLRSKTRVWVTNGISFLGQTDHVVVLHAGSIRESGSYNQLIEAQGDFYEFLEEFSVQSTEQDEGEGNGVQRQQSEKEKEKVEEREKKEEEKKTEEKTALLEKETAAQGSVKLRIYLTYFRSVGLHIALAILFSLIITNGLQVGSSIWLSIWSNDAQDRPDNKKYIGVYAALGGANSLGILAVSLFMVYGCIRSSRYLHDHLLAAVLRAPMSFFDTSPLGRILNRFSKDIYVVDETIPRSLSDFLNTFMEMVSIVFVVGYTTPYFLAALIPLCLLYYFIQRYYVPTSRQLQRMEGLTRSPIYAQFSETLSGVMSIRAYKQQAAFVLQNESKVDQNLEAYYPTICANRWLATRLETLGNMIIFLAGLFAVVERDRLNPGAVGLSLSYALSVTQTLNWMVRMSSQLEADVVAVERLDEYIHLPQEKSSAGTMLPDPSWPTHGEVTFKDYSVRYREGLPPVLHNINLQIRPQEKVGIVGRTGAGKSSFTLGLFRIIEPLGGTVSIDGRDITTLGLDELRSALAIIPQDPVLFSGTVRSNLDPFNRYSDEFLWNALKVCALEEHVTTLEGGLNAKVAEGGENFSVGQRQLICLARALLRRAKILVLDEATGSIDLETDELIQETIRREFKSCTIITIAHRLNTIMDSDRILVLDKGSVAEFDTPANLLADKKSIFYGMASAAHLL